MTGIWVIFCGSLLGRPVGLKRLAGLTGRKNRGITTCVMNYVRKSEDYRKKLGLSGAKLGNHDFIFHKFRILR
jgi:hypothetical protein